MRQIYTVCLSRRSPYGTRFTSLSEALHFARHLLRKGGETEVSIIATNMEYTRVQKQNGIVLQSIRNDHPDDPPAPDGKYIKARES